MVSYMSESFVPKEILDFIGNKRGHKLNTRKILDSRIKRIYKQGLDIDIFDIDLLNTRINDIIKFIDGIKSIESAKGSINSILIILEDMNKYTLESRRIYNEKNFELRKKKLREKSFKKSDVISNMKLKHEEINKLGKRYMKNPVNRIIGLIYGHMFPMRPQELYDLVVLNNKSNDEINYIDRNTLIVTINNYKTNNFYGVRRYKIPEIIKKEVVDYLKLRKDGEYFIVNNRGGKYNNSSMYGLVKRVFGVNVNTIRRLYVSEIYHYLNTEKKDDRKIKIMMSELMGHSTSSQAVIYSSNSNDVIHSCGKYMEKIVLWMKDCYIYQ
jgi:hypothetical protein